MEWHGIYMFWFIPDRLHHCSEVLLPKIAKEMKSQVDKGARMDILGKLISVSIHFFGSSVSGCQNRWNRSKSSKSSRPWFIRCSVHNSSVGVSLFLSSIRLIYCGKKKERRGVISIWPKPCLSMLTSRNLFPVPLGVRGKPNISWLRNGKRKFHTVHAALRY